MIRVARPVPQAAISVNPETGKYGFTVWIPGKRPHYTMEGVFATPADALDWLDPHRERIWEEPLPASAALVAVSRGYTAGSVPARLLVA
jgi:hypothetical protein